MSPTVTGLTDLATVAKGQLAAEMLPLIEEHVSGFRRTLFTKVFSHIAAGTLTGERAAIFWQELYAYHRLLKSFETTITMGKSAASALPMPPLGQNGYIQEGNT